MSELSPLQYIDIGPHGTFKPGSTLSAELGHIDTLVAHLDQVDKLAIHFHGGLVNEARGIKIAKSMNGLYQSAGCHPVSVIWRTGLWEIIRGNLDDIAKSELAKIVFKLVARRAGRILGVDPGSKGPGGEITDDEFESELAKDEIFGEFEDQARQGADALAGANLDRLMPRIERELQRDLAVDQDLVRRLERNDSEMEPLRKALPDEAAAEGARGPALTIAVIQALAPIAWRVIKRYVGKRDHGFYPTVVEETLRALFLAELGKTIWDEMKDAAGLMWAPTVGALSLSSHPGSYFLDQLAALKQRRPELRIDLIGHSAGSIAICRLLAAAARHHPGLCFGHVIFMAPACTAALFYDEVASWPERYQDFRMFTMSDAYETHDRLVPGLYTRSLLYLVSGAFEEEADDPLAGMERHVSGLEPYRDDKLVAVHEFLHAPGQQRLVLSRTPTASPDGMRSEAIHHGDFDNTDIATRESLKFILAR